jgi:hypothetical protein
LSLVPCGAMLPVGCGWCVQTVAKIARLRGKGCVNSLNFGEDLRRDALLYISPKLTQALPFSLTERS